MISRWARVAPVTAVFAMRWTASAAMSASSSIKGESAGAYSLFSATYGMYLAGIGISPPTPQLAISTPAVDWKANQVPFL